MLQDLEVLQCEQQETLSSLAESQAGNLSLKSALEASQLVSLSCQCHHVPVICHAWYIVLDTTTNHLET